MYLSAHSPLGKKITALAFAVLGGIFVVIGGIGSLRTYELVSHGLRTTGAVTEVIRSTGDDGSDRYTPVITYTC
ncbi:MAG TPA: hypothetical protein PK765_05630 [bacterium]|nr:hypothetical protein [bacterium]